MTNGKYIGRFAPSPTGPLHFGSLVTAVASYFQAKHNNGKWLVRIEDIDKEREQIGATSLILKTLEAHHLFWDGEVIYQSSRKDYYNHAIEKLHKLNKLYRCQCSRKSIQQNLIKHGYTNTNVYPGTCRNLNILEEQPHSLRLLVGNQTISFTDTIQGSFVENIQQHGDFVLQKMDGSVTYQLAVAIDDALLNISEVVRGVDLLNSCPKQIIILKFLDCPIPQYCHLPIVCHQDGTKLSKQTGSSPIENTRTTLQLWKALSYLSQCPPPELQKSNIQELHNWATQNWDITKISNKHNSLIYI